MRKLVFVLYGMFLLAVTIFSYLFVDQNLAILHRFYSGFTNQNRELTAVLFTSIVGVFFIFYLYFLRQFNKRKFNNKDAIILILMTIATLILAYPAMLAYDIFNYIATAKVAFFYHENPYITMPMEFIKDPILIFTRATNKVALYGPVWIGPTSIPYMLGFGNYLAILLLFKILVGVFYVGTIALLWKLTGNINRVILFALNPLVVLEALVSGHNDIVMVFLLLFSYMMFVRKKIWTGIVFFVASILIKYATIFLLPIVLYVLWKDKKGQVVPWDRVYFLSGILLMGEILVLAPLREEIYPWYALWFLVFAALSQKNKLFIISSLVLSFSLLLRYIPVIATGNYFGSTPLIKILVTFVPLILTLLLFSTQRIWLKKLRLFFS